MAENVPQHVPLPLPERVEQVEAGDRRERIFEDDVDAAGIGDPFQPRVKDEQRQERQPEDRHRVADEADDADDLVGDAAALDGGENAERHAEDGADEGAERRKLHGRREDAADVGHDGVRGRHRNAEIAGQRLADIDEELLVEGQVQPHRLARPFDDVRRRPVAENGQNRVDRDHPADEEGDGQKAEIGGDDNDKKAQHG
ncbi:hypothetical protein D9M72_475760 [compost metagenome]